MDKETIKVKMINIIDTPIGFITHKELLYPDAGSLSGYHLVYKFWGRLENGILLKDVLKEEFEILLNNNLA